MGISAAERETVIQWSDADNGIAHIYSCQRRMMRMLKKHPLARRVATHRDVDGNVTGKEYEIPRLCIRIIPGKKRQLSQEQREAARQRMKAMRRAPVEAAR